MAIDSIPDDVRRFVLTSISSVPYLEAMLLLRAEAKSAWDSSRLARRLYISKEAAADLLIKLCEAGVLHAEEATRPSYRYRPVSSELAQLVDRTAAIYARHLREMTDMIHAQSEIKVQQFADAFRIRKDN